LTRFHDQEEQAALKPNARIPVMPAFRGRLDDFRFINAAVSDVALRMKDPAHDH
jgi:hypothetical protein